MSSYLPAWAELPAWAQGCLSLLFFALAFALLWFGIVFLLSLFGWYWVARCYPDLQVPGATELRYRSGLLGAQYHGCLRFDVSPHGLRVAMLPIFRFGHRPFFVPWSDVTVEHRRRFLTEYWAFHFAARPRPPLLVSPALGQQLLAAGRAEPPQAAPEG